MKKKKTIVSLFVLFLLNTSLSHAQEKVDPPHQVENQLRNLITQNNITNWTVSNSELTTTVPSNKPKKGLLSRIGLGASTDQSAQNQTHEERRFEFKPSRPIDERTLKILIEQEKYTTKVDLFLYRDEQVIWDNKSAAATKEINIEIEKPLDFSDATYAIVAKGVDIDIAITIKKINYSSAQAPCVFKGLIFSDSVAVYQSGNSNNILSPFEIAKLDVELDCKHWREKNISLYLDGENYLKPLTSFELASPEEGTPKNIHTYSMLLTPAISDKLKLKDTLEFKVNLNFMGLMASQTFNIPYQHITGDQIALNGQTQLTPFNFESEEELDRFLKRYPNSENAPAIFAIRNALPKKLAAEASSQEEILNAIDSYHRFISTYAEYTGVIWAYRDVFDLYEKINSVVGYADFIQRYPFALESHLAEEHIKKLLYEGIIQQDDLEAYDFYISSYPTAHPYVDRLIERAKEIYGKNEERWIAQISAEFKPDNEVSLYKYRTQISDRASAIIRSLYETKDRLKKSSLTLGDVKLLKVQIDRYSYAIETHYKDTNALHTLLVLKDTQEVLGAISKLSDLVKTQHDDIKQTIQTEMSGVRTFLSERFDRVDESLSLIEKRLIAQEKATQDINKRLDDINGLLDNHYNLLTKVASKVINTSLMMGVNGGKQILNKMSAHMPSVDGFNRMTQASLTAIKDAYSDPKLRKILKVDNLLKKSCNGLSILTSTAMAVASGPSPMSLLTGRMTKSACKWALDKYVLPSPEQTQTPQTPQPDPQPVDQAMDR